MQEKRKASHIYSALNLFSSSLKFFYKVVLLQWICKEELLWNVRGVRNKNFNMRENNKAEVIFLFSICMNFFNFVNS